MRNLCFYKPAFLPAGRCGNKVTKSVIFKTHADHLQINTDHQCDHTNEGKHYQQRADKFKPGF